MGHGPYFQDLEVVPQPFQVEARVQGGEARWRASLPQFWHRTCTPALLKGRGCGSCCGRTIALVFLIKQVRGSPPRVKEAWRGFGVLKRLTFCGSLGHWIWWIRTSHATDLFQQFLVLSSRYIIWFTAWASYFIHLHFRIMCVCVVLVCCLSCGRTWILHNRQFRVVPSTARKQKWQQLYPGSLQSAVCSFMWWSVKCGQRKKIQRLKKANLLYSRVLGGGRGVSLNAMRVSGKQQILVRWQKTVKGKVEARTFIGFFRKGKEGCSRQFRMG